MTYCIQIAMSMNSRKGKSIKINFEEFKRPTENSREPTRSNSPTDNNMKLRGRVVRQINKENPSNRTAAFVEQLHKRRMGVTIQKSADHSALASKCLHKFDSQLGQQLQMHRETRIQSLQNQPKYVDSEDIAKQKSVIKVCKSQILENHEAYKKKKNLKAQSSQIAASMVQKVEKFLEHSSEILQEEAIAAMIHPLFERTIEMNEKSVNTAILQSQFKQTDLLQACLELNQGNNKRSKLKRLEAVQKKLKFDELMNRLYPNNMEGVLITAEDLFSHP